MHVGAALPSIDTKLRLSPVGELKETGGTVL
jgi:hypothetical protein